MRVILLEAYDIYPITFLVLTLFCDTFDTRVGSTPSTQSRNTPFLWTRQLLNDFLEIRTMIANPSLLFQIDSSKPLYLETDASELGFGAMLYQEDTEGSTTIVKPIVYHAREWQSPTFRGTRVNPGNALRRELKALQLSILHFDKILTNRPFNIITDNICVLHQVQNAFRKESPKIPNNPVAHRSLESILLHPGSLLKIPKMFEIDCRGIACGKMYASSIPATD